MKVTIALKGTLKKLFEGDTERVLRFPITVHVMKRCRRQVSTIKKQEISDLYL